MIPIGLIIGKGFVKAASPSTTVVFPAVAAMTLPGEYQTAAARTLVDLNGAGEWVVGDDALALAPGRLVAPVDRGRYGEPAFLALARVALRQVAPAQGPLRVLTSIPSGWWHDESARGQLAAAVAQAATPPARAQVTVVPEAAEVYYRYVIDGGRIDPERMAGRVGIVNAGYGDINIGHFVSGKHQASDSVPGGAVVTLRQVRGLIAAAYGVNLPLPEVDAAVRAGGLRVDGQWQPLPPGSAEALISNLDAALSLGRSLWPEGGRTLDAIVLGGGHAPVLAAALAARVSVPVVALENAQVAGAQALCELAAIEVAAQPSAPAKAPAATPAGRGRR